MSRFDFNLSVAVLGDRTMGKTSLVRILCEHYVEIERPTYARREAKYSMAVRLAGRRAKVEIRDFIGRALSDGLLEMTELYESELRRLKAEHNSPLASSGSNEEGLEALGTASDDELLQTKARQKTIAATDWNPFDANVFIIVFRRDNLQSFERLKVYAEAARRFSTSKHCSIVVLESCAHHDDVTTHTFRVTDAMMSSFEKDFKSHVFPHNLLTPDRSEVALNFEKALTSYVELLAPCVIRRGRCLKQGSRIKSWRSRLFVLEADGVLKYYKGQEKGRKCKGKIDVTKLINIATYQECGSLKWPTGAQAEFCFGLNMGSRTYYIVAEDEAEAAGWQRDISAFF